MRALRVWIETLMVGLLCCAQFATSGCVPSAGRRPPEYLKHGSETPSQVPVRSYFFQACKGTDYPDPKAHAFAAMLLALQEKEWVIQELDRPYHRIFARACLRNNPRLCATLKFVAEDHGGVRAVTSKQAPPSGNMFDDIDRWMTVLDSSFSKFRCYTDEALDTEMTKYGY